jgi:AraC-like DNA-binding protein
MAASVVSLVYYEHQPEEYVLPHDHTYYELVFYKEGTGKVNVKEEEKRFAKGSVFVIRPGIKHDEYNDAFSTVYIVLFKSDVRLDNMFVHFDQPMQTYVTGLFENALREYKKQSPMYQEYVDHTFNLILIEAMRLLSFEDEYKTQQLYVKHAKKYIRENVVKNIDFNMLAMSSGYSYDRFRHIFKDISGVTLKQYVLNTRLDKAKQILSETEHPIKDIARMCGFSTTAGFVGFFTSRMRISPTKFRRVTKEKTDLGVVSVKKEKRDDA